MAEKKAAPKQAPAKASAGGKGAAPAKSEAPAKAARAARAAAQPRSRAKRVVARPATRAVRPVEPRPPAEPRRAATPRPRPAARPLPTAPAGHAPVVAADGSASGSIVLPAGLAAAKRRAGVLFQAFQAARANARLATAATRNRSRVAGGGAKPYRQKGTGRARQGSIRAPQFRHGAVVFGPNGRRYWQRIPERMRKAAFAEAFAARAAEGRVVVFDEIGGLSERPRSREIVDWLARIGDTGRTVIVTPLADEGRGRAVANLARVELRSVGSLRLQDVLAAQTLVVARPALDALAARADVAAVRATSEARS